MRKFTVTKIACYIGYFVQAIACCFLPLLFVTFQRTYGFSYEQLGRLTFICFFTQIFVDILSVKFTKRFGYKKMAIIAQIFAAVGFLSIGFLPEILPAYSALAIAVVIYSIGSGLIEVVISPIIEYLPTENKSGNMALLHSFFCWGNVFVVVATTLLLYILGENGWAIITALWSVIPIVTMCLFFFAPVVEPQPDKKHSEKELFSSPVFYIMLLLMVLSGASEISVSNWISAFAEQSLKITKVTADLVGPCLFAVFMGIGRLLFSFFGDKIKMKKLLMVLSFFTAVFYIVLSLSENPVLSLVSSSLIGLCVSVMWPGVLSLSSSLFSFGTTVMFATLAMFGDIGCSVGPWITGIIADQKGLNTAFFYGSLFPVLMFILLVFLNRRSKAK
ncbi:MAG: MFS transporter [Ruminococcaceae bacterium]|nr:MFS transporter [Oscillospiraceae bacterium]